MYKWAWSVKTGVHKTHENFKFELPVYKIEPLENFLLYGVLLYYGGVLIVLCIISTC